MKVVIAGLGDIGKNLAETLCHHEHNELVLIDINQKRCEELSTVFDALVLNGDATDPEILKKADISSADAIVATTDGDAINTVIAMLGHRFGVDKIIVKLKDLGLRAACREIGVTKIIAPKISAAADIVSSLHGFDRLDFSMIIRGGIQLVELNARSASGHRLDELDMPEGILIIAVLRGQKVLLPRGKTKLEENDIVFALVENEKALKKLISLIQ